MTAQCHCQCCQHGILSLDDRLAAFEAGRAIGVVEGRLDHVNDLLDVQALRQAADLLNGFVTRTLAMVTGPEWAALQGDDERREMAR